MREKARHPLIYLAIVAMFLRALLPAGWMPNPNGFLQSPLVICLMDMPGGMSMSHMMDMSKPMDMDMPGHGHDQGQQQGSDQCPFAAAPHFATPITFAAVALPAFSVGLVRDHQALGSSARALPYSPQSPRAPPSLV